jgi:hypothetical protein
MPNPALESGALTQDSPDDGASARKRLLSDIAAKNERTPTDSGEPQSSSPEEPVSRASWADQSSETDTEEERRLRQLVAEQERAALHASLAEFDLRQRLKDTEQKNVELQTQLQTRSGGKPPDAADSVSATEVAKLKLDWRRAMKGLEQENKEHKSELVLVKGQLHQAQRQLELENTARQGDATKSAAIIADLETDLEGTRNAGGKSGRTQSGRHSTGWRIAAIAITAGALTYAVAMRIMHASGAGTDPGGNPASAAAAQPAETFSLPGVTPAGNSAPKSDPVSEPGLTGDLDRLNGAFAAFPGRQPEDILREIHRKAAKTDPGLCTFDWNNGQPSILYGGGGKLSLSASIDKCARAIEKYH